MSTTNETAGMEAKTFDVDGLVPRNCATLTGMRDEVVLISWLIVLMRMQESSLVRCEWQYHGSEEIPANGDAVRTLSPNDVMIGMQSHAGQAAAMLARTIPTTTQTQQSALETPASLRLSTGSLSPSPENATDEVSFQRHSYSMDGH